MENPDTSLRRLLDTVNVSEATEKELIKKAFSFAMNAHANQRRYSGEQYFKHTYETALITAELGMGPRTVAAALLHDTIEDADIAPETIGAEFGKDIQYLVSGVTKLGKLKYKGLKRHVESLRKLFIATSKDIRVLIIKIADRLQNMRTLEFVPKEKRRRIALETLEVYAPIAHRLGMGRITGELEDLAFEYVYPEEYAELYEITKRKYSESEVELEKIYKKLQRRLAEEKIHGVETGYRRKHLYSLWKKMRNKDTDIDQIYDISALRIIVPTISDCYRVLGLVHSLWRPLPGQIKDYIAFPKPNGYQSIHTTIFTGSGGIAEIQIRTRDMHRDAEFGIASHAQYKSESRNIPFDFSWVNQFIPSLKGKKSPQKVVGSDIPAWVKELAGVQKDVLNPEEFIQNLKTDFFEDRIFAFTPNGDVIDLPAGSSPIDFAYHIHTELGNSMSGAKINGKMASLDTELKNGDIVEVVTRKSSMPTQKWLQYAKTALAQRRIKAALADED